MRRKSDTWQTLSNQGSFLPGEGQQAEQAVAADVQVRLTTLEEQMKAQFTSMSAYHQIAVQTTDMARAEARADLDREKATLISLVERARDECVAAVASVVVTPVPAPAADPVLNVTALARIAVLEDRFEELGHQVAQCLRSQQDLADSITLMFEHQMGSAPA